MEKQKGVDVSFKGSVADGSRQTVAKGLSAGVELFHLPKSRRLLDQLPEQVLSNVAQNRESTAALHTLMQAAGAFQNPYDEVRPGLEFREGASGALSL